MEVWAIANHKGGVGRTTTAIMLGRQLVSRGKRVLLVDIDPLASMTRAFDFGIAPLMYGSYDLFQTGTPSILDMSLETAVPKLRLLGSQPALGTVERRGAVQPALGMALPRSLQSAAKDFDYILVDCPPSQGFLVASPMVACDRVVIPTLPDPMSLHGLSTTYQTCNMLQAARRRPMKRYIITTMHDRRTRSSIDNTWVLRDQYGDDICPIVVPEDTRLREPSFMTAPETPRGRGPDAYRRALEWILK